MCGRLSMHNPPPLGRVPLNKAELNSTDVDQTDSNRILVCVVVSFFFAPAQDSRLMQHSSLPRCCLIDPLPLRNRMLFGAVGARAPHHSILQDPGLMQG